MEVFEKIRELLKGAYLDGYAIENFHYAGETTFRDGRKMITVYIDTSETGISLYFPVKEVS